MTDLHARNARRYPISIFCVLLGVSKQAYYKHDGNADLAKAAQEDFALQYIRQIRSKDPGIGGTKLWHTYRREFAAANTVAPEGCKLPNMGYATVYPLTMFLRIFTAQLLVLLAV